MAIEVEVFGNEQIPKHKSNVIDYSYSEDSTPVIPGDSSGGVGSISFSAMDDAATSTLLYGDTMYLHDTHQGNITGRIESISGNNGVVNFDGISDLARLNIERTVARVDSTVGVIIETILAEAGIISGFDIDPDVYDISATSPQYTGDLWVFLKDLCTAYEFELALVDDTIVFRKLRERTINLFDVMDESWSVSGAQQAQTVEVNYYNYESQADVLVYPKGGWNSDVNIYSVTPGETLDVKLTVDFYVDSVTQPVAVDYVSKEETASVYAVAKDDGSLLPASEWVAYGGSIAVTIDPDNSSVINVKIVGANIAGYKQFKIAMNDYSSLRIRGAGLAFTKETVSVPTGLTEDETSNVIGATIDNKFISTKQQAYDAGKRAILNYGMPKVGYSFTAPSIGDFLTAPGQIVYTHFFEYDKMVGTESFTDVDASIDAWSFTEFDDHLPSSTVDGTEYQMFGNVNGARVKFRDSWFRVRSANITPTSVDASTDWDNLFSDFNTVNTDRLFSDVNATFDQLSFTDFHMIPLRSS